MAPDQSTLIRRITRFFDRSFWPIATLCVAVVSPLQTAHASDVPAGTILVLDNGSADNTGPTLYAVNPLTHRRTLQGKFLNTQGTKVAVDPLDMKIVPTVLNGALLGSSLYVMDTAAGSGTGAYGAILKVDPATGVTSVFSDGGDTAQGPNVRPAGAFVARGLLDLVDGLYAVDPYFGAAQSGAVLRVDLQTGQRSVVSDGNNASLGPTFSMPVGITGTPGMLYVVDSWAGTSTLGAVFSVNPNTGQRTLVSDLGNAQQGPTGRDPIAIATVPTTLGLGDLILVVDDMAGTNEQGALFSIDPSNGKRTLLYDFGAPGATIAGRGPEGIHVVPGLLGLGSTIYVVDSEAGAQENGALFAFQFDPVNMQVSQPTVVTDFNNAAQNDPAYPYLGVDPTAVVVR